MSVILPTPDRPASIQLITLDEVPYGLLLTWNERAAGWVLGLQDRDSNPVILGRRVVLQLDMLQGYHHLPNVPTGGLFALSATGKLDSITKDDLAAGRILIYYIPRDELDAL